MMEEDFRLPYRGRLKQLGELSDFAALVDRLLKKENA
jgi:hypothetical protein